MYVKNIEKIEVNEPAGEKASKLSEMLKERMPVPEGFVITREGYEFFLKKNNLVTKIRKVLENLDIDDYNSLVKVSEEIKNMFVSSQIPDSLKNEIMEGYDGFMIRKEAKNIGGAALDFIRAGRDSIFISARVSGVTSPNSSLPGLFDSFLNISGQHSLLQAIKLCWASLYSPRAIYYRQTKGFSDDSLGGIIVQRMVDSEKSGVVSSEDDNVVIEGSWGLGTSISYGLVSPDRYSVDGYSGEIHDRSIGKKVWFYKRDPVSGKTVKECVLREKINEQLLNEKEISKIFELYRRVTDHYGKGQVIEWGIERGRVYLLQVRSQIENQVSDNGEEEGVCVGGYGISRGFVKGPSRIITNTSDFEKIGKGDIIVTKILSPELIPFIGKAGGVITEYGGIGSSVSFICKEMGIPCVSDIEISGFSDNQMISINGGDGKVYSFEEKSDLEPDLKIGRLEGVNATAVKLNFDISRPFEFDGSVDGIGLLTSEGLFANQNPFYMAKTNPEEILNSLAGIETIARNLYPKTVWYRSYSSFEEGVNPVLGVRGVRKSLEEPEMLKCEIETLKRLYSKGLDNVGIMLSFVSNISEFRAAKQFIPFSMKLGVEISIPSTALEIESFCKEGLNLVSINLPELTQLTLGVDRGNSRVSYLYSESDPSLMKLIENVVRICKQYNVETSVSLDRYEPSVIENLVRIGVSSMSLNPEHAEEARSLISRTEKRILLDKFRDRGDFEIVS